MAEEHLNVTESHYSENCPGEGQCAVYDGLGSVLDRLKKGELVITRVDSNVIGTEKKDGTQIRGAMGPPAVTPIA